MPLTTLIIAGLTLEALGHVAVAVLVLRLLGLRERLGRALALYSTISALWAVFIMLGQLRYLGFLQAEFVSRLPLYGTLTRAVFGLYLSRAFLRVEDRRGAYWYLAGAIYGLAVTLIDSNLLPLGPNWPAVRDRVIIAALAMGWGVFAAAIL